MPMRWQLIPRWWKKSLKDLPATFNARAESVAEKPMFRDAFKRNRCLIPASGYFEWHTSGKEKQPYYITPRNGSVLTIAGLWEEWRDRVKQRNDCLLHHDYHHRQLVRQHHPRPNARDP
jgi:putative SOS response-associated peptidase YedK